MIQLQCTCSKSSRGSPHQGKGHRAGIPEIDLYLRHLNEKSNSDGILHKIYCLYTLWISICFSANRLRLLFNGLNVLNGSCLPPGFECSPFAEGGIMTLSICLKHPPPALPSRSGCATLVAIYTGCYLHWGASRVMHAPLTGRQSILSLEN